jgi:hypothetical protein
VHVALVRSGSTTTPYINGVVGTPVTNSIIGGNLSNAQFLTFGRMSSTTSANASVSMIDDVRFYTKALSAGEVLALYDSTDEVSSKIDSSNFFEKQDRSYSFWIKQTTHSQERLMRCAGTYIFITSAGRFYVTYYNGSGYPGTGTTPSGSNGVWQHVVITTKKVDTTALEFRFYINGVLDKIYIGDTLKHIGSSTFSIGYSDSINFFRGWLDDIRVYNEAIGLNEVKFIYNEGRGRTDPSPSSGTKSPFGGLLKSKRHQNKVL